MNEQEKLTNVFEDIITGGCEDQAVENAKLWLLQMEADGIRNVEIASPPEYAGGNRWRFIVRHKITDVEVTLDIHGYTEEEVQKYVNGNHFSAYPGIRWNGCSLSEPCLEDFLSKGFHIDIVKD